ncbi:MAG: Asp-tRNA(Asn)/Glu-tRNA(Gln) amidotransferase subunit GatA [Gemmatimonadota bacterium]|nr:Asp-tRNA(Asn)/Glu-tRNA(Gln) amidotransferase subunit GatA [Gemmatimonadota bacterium]MDP6802828.1 Asp-tRNA(Asn)/Glu-tRNA(Gln) amidotransferase subunit GatA [Gemmatimonadota bacterium]
MRPGLRSVPELSRALALGELSSADLVEDCLARIDELDGTLNLFLHVDAEGAREAAAASDSRREKGDARSPLDGIPVALKDNIAVRGMPTTCASRVLEGFVPLSDATAVARLRAAGAVLVGKTNLDEFAMGSSNEHSAFGPSRNPHDAERVPGGSSGGSCAAVACGMVPLAYGSDTGGSVRLPAAFCGVVGVKPGYGRVSRSGLVAFASSLDQIAPTARTVEGAALGLAAVAGADPADATALSAPPPCAEAASPVERPSLAGLTLGILDSPEDAEADSVVAERFAESVARLESLGARTVRVSLPNAGHALSAYYVIASAEASSNLSRYDGVRYGRAARGASSPDELIAATRGAGFGDEVKRRVMIGTHALSAGYREAFYERAQAVRELIRDDFARAFAAVDLLVSPTAATTAFPLGERLSDPLSMYRTDALTIPASLAGIPAMSVPCPTAPGELPAGLQILAPPLGEDGMLRAAAALECETGPAPAPALAVEGGS